MARARSLWLNGKRQPQARSFRPRMPAQSSQSTQLIASTQGCVASVVALQATKASWTPKSRHLLPVQGLSKIHGGVGNSSR
jgi:hypothetical protein